MLNEGGQAGCSETNVQSAPVFEKGGRYVIFTRQGEDATGKHADLDWVLAAWPIDADDNVATEEDGLVPLAEVAARLAAIAP